MKALFTRIGDWVDRRTGHRAMIHEALYENVPGGSSWWYVTGSMLVFAFVTQVVTGLFLWMYYSPGSQNAWASVYEIQTAVQGGWLLRGVHHYMAQAMVVLLPLHLLQVVLFKAYTAPREFNFWLGLILMNIVLGLGLTGYLLPWDQKGYWATKVATELASLPPVVGPAIQKLAVGGDEYGHFTLTRFFALHAGVLPALLVLCLIPHLALFRRHGVTAPERRVHPDDHFWPRQVFKDATACFLLLAAVTAIVCVHPAELGPPAEPTEAYDAARPEWYFLFLFQFLKKCSLLGLSEFMGAIVIPGAVMGFMFLMPFIANIKFGHIVNVVALVALIIGAVYLTGDAWYEDNYHLFHDEAAAQAGDAHAESIKKSQDLHEAQQRAEREYERIQDLIAYYGIPKSGPNTLQHNDPETMGPRLFARHCATCHSYLDENGQGIAASEVSAPNLYGIGTRRWFEELLSMDPEHGIASQRFFGATAHGQKDEDGAFKSGGMVEYVNDTLTDIDDQQKQKLADVIAALSAEANLVAQHEVDQAAASAGAIERGRQALVDEFACTDCHKHHDQGDLGAAPDLTDVYSYPWLFDFIADPAHERFYADNNDRMPAFGELLSDHDIEMLARWLRGDAKVLGAREAMAQAVDGGAVAAQEPAPESSAESPAPGPEAVGLRLFKRHCARCHSYADESGAPVAGPTPKADGDPNGAPNLLGFASRDWLKGFLTPDGIVGNRYFGNTAHGQKDEDGAFKSGGMVEFVHETLTDLDDENAAALENVIIALSAQAQLPAQTAADAAAADQGLIEQGRDAIVNNFACTDCHQFGDDGYLGAAPDLTGYGSADWLKGMISNPEHERFYVDNNDRMPAFVKDPEASAGNLLSSEELDQLVSWIRGDQ